MAAGREQQVYLHKHSRREFRRRMQAGELKACIIPVAATEQHLEHLAMEHDWRSVMHVATEVAARMQPGVIVAPAMNIGISEHHMQHIGTLTALPGSWLGVLFDAIRSMHHAGFQHILVLNGHGGNVAPCLGIWGQFQQRLAFSTPHPTAQQPAREPSANLHFVSYWDLLPKDVAEATLKTKTLARPCAGIRERRLRRRPFGKRPSRRDAGFNPIRSRWLQRLRPDKKLIEAIVVEVTKYVQKMIDGTNIAHVPEFSSLIVGTSRTLNGQAQGGEDFDARHCIV